MRKSDDQSTNHVKDLALEESLSFNTQRVSIINSDPTSPMFVTWFHVSCYFPILTACLGPIANTISIACVVEKWREIKKSEDRSQASTLVVQDPAGIFTFNVISLVLGFISNIVLLLHFSEKLSYLKAQCICIVGWTAASLILLVDVIVCAAKYFERNHEKTIGFWFAAITSGLYFGCTITLTTHFIGFFRGRYPAKFNLIKNERSLMVFTVSFSIILIWGGGMFSALLGISYGNALYFCVVSILTLGLGDILPLSVAAKIMSLVYSTIGVINLALIIAMTRGIFQESAGSVVFFHRVEILRTAELKRIKNGKITYSSEEAFNKMHQIRKIANSRQKLYSLLTTLGAFVIFWNIGGLALMFAENWSYFNSVYFGFLCLLTIGYGDYAPSSGAGRAFFVFWALGAIPLMSAILSTVGDSLLDLADTIDLSIAKKFKMRIRSIVFFGDKSWDSFLFNSDEILPGYGNGNGNGDNDDDDDDDVDVDTADANAGNNSYADGDETTDTQLEDSKLGNKPVSAACSDKSCNIDDLIATDPEDVPVAILRALNGKIASKNDLSALSSPSESTELDEMQRLLGAFKKFRSIAKKSKKYSLTYEQWNDLASLCIFTQDPKILQDTTFWLSEYSPLRFPLDQPRFVVMRLLIRIEELIKGLLEDEEIHQVLARKKKFSNFPAVKYGVYERNLRRINNSSKRMRSMSI